jgi:polysaccharide deacetylase family sporulation protein PdaB
MTKRFKDTGEICWSWNIIVWRKIRYKNQPLRRPYNLPRIFGFYHLPKRLKYLLICFITMVLLSSSMVYVHASNKLKPIYEVKTDKKIAALSFDISWGNKTPMPVIEILEEHGLRCTFFLSGPWVNQYPEVAQKIAANGHEIASHGYRHVNYSTLSSAEIKEEVMKAHKILKEVTGAEPNLIRTPNGDYDDHVIKAISEINYTAIQWSVDSLDWMNPGISTIIERVSKKVHPGAIILMHASDSCKQTTEALPTVIKNLQDQGYELVKVSELLKEMPDDKP